MMFYFLSIAFILIQFTLGSSFSASSRQWEDVGKRTPLQDELIGSKHIDALRERVMLKKRESPTVKTANGTVDFHAKPIQLFPPIGNSSVDIPHLTDMATFVGFRSTDIKVERGANLTVTSTECSLTGNITFRALVDIELDVFNTIANDTKSIFEGKKPNIQDSLLKEGYFEVELTTDLVGTIQLEIASNGTGAIEIETSILPFVAFPHGIPLFPSITFPLVDIGPSLDFAIGALIEVKGPGNFTTGARITVPKGSIMRFDFSTSNNSFVNNWDKAEITSLPIVLNKLPDNEQDFEVEVAFSSIPTILLSVGVGLDGKFDLRAGGKLKFVVPEHWQRASFVSNVTDSCETPSSDDFEYFPMAINIEKGLNYSIKGELFADVEIGPLAIGPRSSLSKTIWEKQSAVEKSCMVFDPVNLGELRSVNDPNLPEDAKKKLDVQKVEQFYVGHGNRLPEGVTVDMLKVYEGQLPPALENLVNPPQSKILNGTGSTRGSEGLYGDGKNETVGLRALQAWASLLVLMVMGLLGFN